MVAVRSNVRNLARRMLQRQYQTLNTVTIDKVNMLSNYNLIRLQHPGMEVMAVLKSNAYGHGIVQVAEILNDANCIFLAVDGYFEAAKIRSTTKHRILVLGYIKPENYKLLDTKKCSFVVQDIASLEALGKLGKRVRIHAELNTGMNRLGLSETELLTYLTVLQKYPKLQLEGVMSHLADADNDKSDDFTVNQTQQFDRLIALIRTSGFNPKYIHIAQTAGSTKVRSKYANSIRLGIGLYGISPLSRSDKNFKDLSHLKPVLELRSTVVKIIDLQQGDRVSYNGIFTAPNDMRIAVLPLGYYEGIPRELSNKGVVTFGDSEFRIVGRVCMNHTMINIGKSGLQVGDVVTVISRNPAQQNSIERIASQHQLFNYVLVTKLSSTIRREVR